MRERSLVGPLLLIGIGALFLARNVVPDLPLLDYLAQYWPFLLILWGALRLLEIATWSVRGKPLPRFGVSGGEWMLVIFLCLLGSSLHAARGFTSWLPESGFRFGGLEVFGESYEYPLSAQTVKTTATPRIVLNGFRGNVRIVGVDGTDVKVSGHHMIRSMNQKTADNLAEAAKLGVRADGGVVTISVANSVSHFDRRSKLYTGSVSTEMDIEVPRGATFVTEEHDGDIDAHQLTGSVEIKANDASVRLEDIGGNVRLELRGSDIVRAVNLKGGLELSGRGNDIDLEKISGEVNVNGSWGGLIQARELAKPLRWKAPQTEMTAQALPGELRWTIGDISVSKVHNLRIDSTYPKDVELTDVTGSLTLDLQRGDVRVSSTRQPVAAMSVRMASGNVDLALPDGAKFNLNAVTDRGEAYSDYGSGVQQQSNGRRGASAIASGGGPSIEVHLNRGDIRVRRNGANATTIITPAGSPPLAVEQ